MSHTIRHTMIIIEMCSVILRFLLLEIANYGRSLVKKKFVILIVSSKKNQKLIVLISNLFFDILKDAPRVVHVLHVLRKM